MKHSKKFHIDLSNLYIGNNSFKLQNNKNLLTEIIIYYKFLTSRFTFYLPIYFNPIN